MWLLVLHQSWGFWYFNAVTVLCAVVWCQVNSVQSNITLHSVNISLLGFSVNTLDLTVAHSPTQYTVDIHCLNLIRWKAGLSWLWWSLQLQPVSLQSSRLLTWPLSSICSEGQPNMSICQKLQIEQYSNWLSSSLSSVKLLIKVRNYVMPLDETDNSQHDETGFCSKVRASFLT